MKIWNTIRIATAVFLIAFFSAASIYAFVSIVNQMTPGRSFVPYDVLDSGIMIYNLFGEFLLYLLLIVIVFFEEYYLWIPVAASVVLLITSVKKIKKKKRKMTGEVSLADH